MIRSILYLDEQKLLSFSSQVLEGHTLYSTRERMGGTRSSEEQKGPLGSGRTLSDVLTSTETSFERRVLHDHAFSILEDELSKRGMLIDANSAASTDDLVKSVSSATFIRIKAPARFVDPAKLANLLRDFNKLGEAVAYSMKHGEIAEAITLLEKQKVSLQDKSKRALLDKQIKDTKDPSLAALKMGLYQDPTFLDSLTTVTEFGYSDQIEIQQAVHGLTLSACLKRESLRESENLIMRKYSRKTEKSLVVLGVVTQTAYAASAEPPAKLVPSNMKEAFNNMIEHIAILESTLSGKLETEVVIDPIAVYASL